MSDKLFVRDIIERLSTLHPTLPTNIVDIKADGLYRDGARVHILDQESFDEETMGEEITLLKRQRTTLDNEVKALRTQREELQSQMAASLKAHEQKLEAMRQLARRIKQGMLQRILPLP
jgi:hypothetical protein